MKVKFIEVGSGKKTWTAELRGLSYRELFNAVKKAHALGSSGIDFDYDDDAGRGRIFVGGFRCVGAFEVVDETPDCAKCEGRHDPSLPCVPMPSADAEDRRALGV